MDGRTGVPTNFAAHQHCVRLGGRNRPDRADRGLGRDTAAVCEPRPLGGLASEFAAKANVGGGHLLAFGIAAFAVYVTGTMGAPIFFDHDRLALVRVGAAALAVALGIVAEFVLRASHPPAASTSLLVTLGILSISWRDTIAVVSEIALVTAFGEVARRLQLRSGADAL